MRYEGPGKPPKPKSPVKVISAAARPITTRDDIAATKRPVPRPPASASRGHGGAAQMLIPGRPVAPGQSYPGADLHNNPHSLRQALTALDSLGKYTVGLGMVSPSRAPGNILESVGVHTRLPHDKKSGTLRRALTTDEFARFQRTGKIPLDAAEPSSEMLPFVPGGIHAKAARAELKVHPLRNEFHANIDRTVADKQLAQRMKLSFDNNVLRQAKKAGLRPKEFLDKNTQPPEAAKVIAGLAGGRAESLRREQEALRHEERVRRAGAFGEELRSNPTLKGYEQARGNLAGMLPKVEHNGLRGLTEDEVNSLVAHVDAHPGLREYEKVRVLDALRNAWVSGKVPTRSEYRLLHEAFGSNFVNTAMHPTVLSKYRHAMFETLNIPRALMASFDLSAPFRQGLVALARHPVMAGKNFGPMVKYLMSEKGYNEYVGDLRASHDFVDMQADGLAITDVEHSLANREEAFQSNYAETITGGKHSPVRASGRAYTGFLVKTRVDMYRYLRDLAEKQGRPLDAKGRSDLANYINAATGRGDLGRFERDAVTLNALLFSPRLMASRLNFLDPRAYMGLDPFVRDQKIRAALQTAGAVSAVLWLASNVAGVEVSLDPTSSDFGKIRVGNTRIDVAGGFVQYIRLISTIGTAMVGKGDGKTPDAIMRFFRGKSSPITSLVTDFATHTNYAGIPIKDWKKEIYDSFIPLVVQDVRDVYHYTGSAGAAAAGALAAGTGIGVQSYGAKPKPAAKGPDPRDKLVASFDTYHIPPAARGRLMGALTARQAVADGKKRLKDTLGVTHLTEKQDAQVLVGVLLSSPTFKPYEAVIRKAWSKSSNYSAKHTLIPVLEEKLGFNDLETYTSRINARAEQEAELKRLEEKAVGG